MSDGYSTANYMAVPDGMKRIRLKCQIVVAGFPGKEPGDVFDVPGALAHHLLIHRWAEEVLPTVSQSGVVESREPVVESRDPQPAVPVQKQPDKLSQRTRPKSAAQ